MRDWREELDGGWAARTGAATGQCDKGHLLCTWNKQSRVLEELTATQLRWEMHTYNLGLHPPAPRAGEKGNCGWVRTLRWHQPDFHSVIGFAP